MLEVTCPSCGEHMEVPDGDAGRETRCPTCGAAIQVPRTGSQHVDVVRVPRAPRAPESPRTVRPAQTVEVHVVGPRPFSGLGVASILLGASSLAVGTAALLIFCVGLFSLLLGLTGLVLGICGIVSARKREIGQGIPIAGTVICAVALVLHILFVVAVGTWFIGT